MKIFLQQNRFNLAISWVLVGVLGRLLPHPANVTPLTSIALFAGSRLTRGVALTVVLVTTATTDILLAFLKGYPLIGGWTLFNYTGFIAIIGLGSRLHNRKWPMVVSYVVLSSLGFWVWTNFGTWLTSGIYPKTGSGLENCYIAALPFLRHALLGDLVWSGIFFGSFSIVMRQISKRSSSSPVTSS